MCSNNVKLFILTKNKDYANLIKKFLHLIVKRVLIKIVGFLRTK